MAVDPRKRQKQLERRQRKQKAKRQELARQKSLGIAGRLRRAATAPIYSCARSSNLFDAGMGYVLVSRLLPKGQVAFGAFLVDVYCLGVKDAFAKIVSRATYEHEVCANMSRQHALVKIQPEYARKLIEEAVQYAGDLGLPPHADYHTAKLIFGDISADACDERFTFGKDGKPFFIAGPHDGPARCQEIIRTLEEHCGPEGYHYLMPAASFPEAF